MANAFVYRADPPCELVTAVELTGVGRAAALMRQQVELGLSVGSSGRLWRTPDLVADLSRTAVEDGFAAVQAELGAMAGPGSLPPKIGLPAPALAGISDTGTFADGLAGLVAAGALYLQFDGAGYVAVGDTAALAADVALLTALPAVEGLVTGIDLGRAAALAVGKAEAILAAIKTRRVTLTFGADDDFALLKLIPDDVLVVLGLIDPDRSETNDAILERIDAAAAVIDSDRLALTATRGFCGPGEVSKQVASLGQVADVSTMFWGFAM